MRNNCDDHSLLDFKSAVQYYETFHISIYSVWVLLTSRNYLRVVRQDLRLIALIYSPYLRRLESLTICWCNYKGSTFYSVILRPWVLVRPESNLRPPTWQPDAQPTEPPVHGSVGFNNLQNQLLYKLSFDCCLTCFLFVCLFLLVSLILSSLSDITVASISCGQSSVFCSSKFTYLSTAFKKCYCLTKCGKEGENKKAY